MKTFLICLAFIAIGFSSHAQIVGNGIQKTKTVKLNNLTEIDIQFNGDIVLDFNQEESMIISTDENVLDYIGIKFENGRLTLDQVKWIAPTITPKIRIGSPLLTYVYQGTHSSTTIENINGEYLKMEGNVGKLIAGGNIKNLDLVSTGTDFDLAQLQIVNADVLIDDDSKVILDKVENLKVDLDEDARLILLSEVEMKNVKEVDRQIIESNTRDVDENIQYIKFKIKNNSWRRNHFVVVGPNKNGRKFSYGFSMFPFKVKNENWTTGTKIFREKRGGELELLVVIDSVDEGTTVDLF